MTLYYRTTDGSTHDVSAEQYALLEANGKAALLRLWSVDPMPTPGASEVVISGGIVVDATTARQTWTVRPKTQAELDADTNSLELPTLLSYIDQWTTDIQAYTPNIDTSGTTAQQAANIWIHIKDLQRQMVRNNRALRWLARERRQQA